MNLFKVARDGEIFNVVIPPKAEVPSSYKPGGRWARLTLQALQEANLRSDEDRIFHRQFYENEQFNLRVVPVKEGQAIRWGIATMHMRENRPQPCPFVFVSQPVKEPYLFLELARYNGDWALVRLYHGRDYIPPLPWQEAADQTPGLKEISELYWQRYALAYRLDATLYRIPFDQLDDSSPEWMRKLQ